MSSQVSSQPSPRHRSQLLYLITLALAAGTALPAAAGTPDEVGGPRAEAEKLMRLAKLYVSNRLYARAREKLNQVIKEHPGSPQADEARKLLKEIGTK